MSKKRHDGDCYWFTLVKICTCGWFHELQLTGYDIDDPTLKAEVLTNYDRLHELNEEELNFC